MNKIRSAFLRFNLKILLSFSDTKYTFCLVLDTRRKNIELFCIKIQLLNFFVFVLNTYNK